MKIAFRSSFARDLKKIRDRSVLNQIRLAILHIEATTDLTETSNLKKLRGDGNFYRIRIGDYRIGISVDGVEIEFVRCLPRKEIYRYFP